MIETVYGDIFGVGAEAIVNPVNTVGVMGAGLAKQFKVRYPYSFAKYTESCLKGTFDIGSLIVVQEEDVVVIMFPTKKHWRNPSRVEYIDAGLETLRRTCESVGIGSVAIPELGCGLGGLDFEKDVRPLVEKHFGDASVRLIVVKYKGEQR